MNGALLHSGLQKINLIEAWRTATAHHHQELERKVDFLNPQFTLESYIQILRKFFLFHQAFELALSTNENTAKLFYSNRSKINLLLSDFKSLGVSLPKENEQSLDFGHYFVSPSTFWGWIYVIEGSTLGGQILTRHFRKHFSFRGEGPFFFSGYGKDTARMWREFLSYVSTLEFSADEFDSAVHGAIHAFQFFSNWLPERSAPELIGGAREC